MHCSRQWFLVSALATVLTGTAAQPVAVRIDAGHTGPPITKLMFGGFMEPATTQVWAEMLSDRKFFNEINSKPVAAPTGGFGRRGPQRRWMPVGGDEFVAMDSKNPYAGERTPLIRVEASTPHGISQSGLALRAGRAYTGRVVIAGSPGGKVEVSLAWGANPGDRQTIVVPALAAYATVPLHFTAKADTTDGRFRDCRENGTVRQDVIAKWAANAPLAFVDQYIGNLRQYRAIAMDVGDQDGLRVDTGIDILDNYGVVHSFEIYSGTHTSAVAVRFQNYVMPFFGKNLRKTANCK